VSTVFIKMPINLMAVITDVYHPFLTSCSVIQHSSIEDNSVRTANYFGTSPWIPT
jgi:hypothetical protein